MIKMFQINYIRAKQQDLMALAVRRYFLQAKEMLG